MGSIFEGPKFYHRVYMNHGKKESKTLGFIFCFYFYFSQGPATTSTSYTVIGGDGLPTIVQSTWVIPTPTPVEGSAGFPGPLPTDGTIPGVPGGFSSGINTAIPSDIVSSIPGGLPGSLPSDSLSGIQSGITTCTSYTIIGTDGIPTVVDSTWVIPGPTNTINSLSGSPGSPLVTGATSSLSDQAGPIPGLPSSAGSTSPGLPGDTGITTCTTYTTIGSDGLPTTVDSTWVIPGPFGTQTSLPDNPSFVPTSSLAGLPTGVPGEVTGIPGIPSLSNSETVGGITTCTTYISIGADGLPTVVESTWIVPSSVPTGTGFSVPSDATPVSSTSDAAAGQFTATTTAIIVGSDGQLTSVVQTIVVTSSASGGLPNGLPQGTVSGVPAPPPTGPILSSGQVSPIATEFPSLSQYGGASIPSIIGQSTGDAAATIISGTVTGTLTSTVTQIINPTDGSIISDGGLGNSVPISDAGYGPIPTELTLWPPASNLETHTWTNLIMEPTTTYTIKFPLTTMATVAAPTNSEPGKQVFRRQQSLDSPFAAWKNSSSSSSPVEKPTISLDPSATFDSGTTYPTVCSTENNIINLTVDFDSAQPGPLFNPVEDIWFSEGFHIAPPSSQNIQPFLPSSGGQIVEFVPPSLSNVTATGSGDVAEIGVGPHAPSPCFRYNFYGARLGCETKNNEKWCEFEISAYRYNDTLSGEESIAWSETKQVPACSTFLEGGYELTPVEFEGYTDLSSVLITVRVGLELRTWWGDDFRVGWSDASCVASTCRSTTPAVRVRRETVESALRRGLYKWSRDGLERYDTKEAWKYVN